MKCCIMRHFICVLAVCKSTHLGVSLHRKGYLLLYGLDLENRSAKTRSDRDKLCHFWSKMKSQESQNKLFLSIASYLVHLILEGFS